MFSLGRLKRSQSSDPDKLERMVNAGKIIVTPCKNLPGIHRSSSYDDRMILEAAEQFEAAIISNDNYADLLSEKPGKMSHSLSLSLSLHVIYSVNSHNTNFPVPNVIRRMG